MIKNLIQYIRNRKKHVYVFENIDRNNINSTNVSKIRDYTAEEDAPTQTYNRKNWFRKK